MIYRNYKLALLFRVTLLFLLLLLINLAINFLDFKTNVTIDVIIIASIALIVILSFINLLKFTVKVFIEIDDFFDAIKYRDFSRWFSEDRSQSGLLELHKGFNQVNETIKLINKEKEVQYIYLQKILELVNTGIIAYSLKSGNVLWVNDSFNKILNIPTIKNISFVKNRKPKIYTAIFESDSIIEDTISIETDISNVKVLMSNSIFNMEKEEYKLVVLQNIDVTLNQHESEAWRKLLSVMTHEIMNSIAPISSLAETMHSKIQLSIDSPDKSPLQINDFQISIESIRKRSEGLMKFAKTYRGLNKATNLNPSKVMINDLFINISNLLQPSLESKNIELKFSLETPKIQIEIDRHLIEQVLINLIVNAIEACKNLDSPNISISANQNVEGETSIKIIDNGKGIPDEFTDKIFIPFFSTKKNGSGIGLSFCKQIMMLHKGSIGVKSIEKKGTEITLVFPLSIKH